MTNKKTDWFRGIFPALVTPFTADDQFDGAAYRDLIRFVLPHVNGVVPCGTTGEFSSMTLAEMPGPLSSTNRQLIFPVKPGKRRCTSC